MSIACADDPDELELLVKDLYIKVTSFFRDPRCSITSGRALSPP